MQNISYGLNEDCLAAMSKSNEEWKCGNAQVWHLLHAIMITTIWYNNYTYIYSI